MVTIRVMAGPHRREACPTSVAWRGGPAPAGLDDGSGAVAAQADGGRLVLIPREMAAGEERLFRPAEAPEDGVKVEDDGARIAVTVSGEPFTVYHYAEAPARPYFWPVLAPDGIPATRGFPMEPRQEETDDHPHHRSLYFAYGDVNGVDNWSEELGHGFTRHRSVDERTSGPVFGRFATTSEWTDAAGAPLLRQSATVTVWNAGSSVRMMDVELRLTPTAGPVIFGDTKEGGLLTVRVASALDVPRGGRITNAQGGVNEGETWGQPSPWCDYTGIIEGRTVGVAVMDHAESFRFPARWHVRDYGLMAANPFALGAYTGGRLDGRHNLTPGETLRFSYRVLVHRGADVRAHYLNYAFPPKGKVKE